MSARTMPTKVTLGMSWPLAIIWVPTRMSMSPERKRWRISSKAPLGGGAVAIEPGDARAGKMLVQFVFNAFGASAEELNVFAMALGADGWNLFGEPAHVAEHAAVAAVQGQHDGAVGAEQALATIAAEHEAGKAAAVEEQHGLFSLQETLLHFFEQGAREGRLALSLEELNAHVNDANLRHGALGDAVGKAEHVIAPAPGC